MMAQHEAAVTSHPTRQQLIKQQLILSTRGTAMAALLLCILGAAWGCDREPGIIVNIAAWPDAIEQIRVRTGIDGTLGTDFYLNKGQTRFVVRVPVGSQGTVQIDAAGLDAMGCKRAVGSLTEPVPDNLSHIVERTLELQLLPASACGQDPVIFVDIAGLPAGVKRMRVRWSLGGTAKPDMFLGPIPSQFNLPLPAGSVGSVHLEAVAIDAGDCKVAAASLDVMVSGSPGYFAKVTLSFAPSSPACMFAGSTDFSTGTKPNSVAIGDFNRDQKPDLAIADEMDGNVSVLLGKGGGDFGPATKFPVGVNALMNPFSVAVGDFNRDQKPDLAVANNGSNNVSVLLGNGMGGFGVATTFSVGMGPTAVVVGDFNGDQKPDLAVANSGDGNVCILRGDGLGGFGAAANFLVGMAPYSVVVGDFNGDQKQDLAIANDGSANVSVLLGNGLGSFGTASNFLVGTRPESVVVGDFNGDQKTDLGVANYGSDTVSVLLGNGLGDFAAATHFAAGTQPTAIAVADFDGDMTLDLAVSNWDTGSLRVLLGNGKGSFAASTTNFPVGSHPISVAMGNFNEDQKPDLAITNWDSQSVSVLINQF